MRLEFSCRICPASTPHFESPLTHMAEHHAHHFQTAPLGMVYDQVMVHVVEDEVETKKAPVKA